MHSSIWIEVCLARSHSKIQDGLGGGNTDMIVLEYVLLRPFRQTKEYSPAAGLR
jgi:hypothetical protein